MFNLEKGSWLEWFVKLIGVLGIGWTIMFMLVIFSRYCERWNREYEAKLKEEARVKRMKKRKLDRKGGVNINGTDCRPGRYVFKGSNAIKVKN